jgi:hypothetical protein
LSALRSSELHRGRRTPFVLREEWGVRAALLLLALKPLRKTSRMERIAQAIGAMTEEECYYWFSKCVGDGRQAQDGLGRSAYHRNDDASRARPIMKTRSQRGENDDGIGCGARCVGGIRQFCPFPVRPLHDQDERNG